MNTINLFDALITYRPRERANSKENFLTESLAYTLRKDKRLRVRYRN